MRLQLLMPATRRLFWTGFTFALFGSLGIAFSCFVGWIFADGEAGRMHYHNGHIPPMTLGDKLGLAAMWAVIAFPFDLGLLLGIPLLLAGLRKCRHAAVAEAE